MRAISLSYFLLLLCCWPLSATAATTGAIPDEFPSSMTARVEPVYVTRTDGQPGRLVILTFSGGRLFESAQLEVKGSGNKEISTIPSNTDGRTEWNAILPTQAGVSQEARLMITLRQGSRSLKCSVVVPPMRHWTVYIYPHSHVDIGYTNTQANVEILHKRNIEEGIRLAEETRDYPQGARYRWNPEVTWPLERYWQTATPEQKERVVEAIRNGWLCQDASYLNTNTSGCTDEELFQMFRFSREIQQLTGVPSLTLQQMDIPGMSWGLVPVMAQQGVRYILSWPNSCRAGYSHELDEKPFWWVGPDGQSKVLFYQPGGYANSGSMAKGAEIGRPWFGQRDPDKVPAVIRTGNANVDFLKALQEREKPGYPFDFYLVSWCLWDNTPIDADLPDAVRAWNGKYAFPHLVIAGADEVMQMIEKKYGDQLPTVTGDFTEYWTDGLGTAAGLTAINRNARERIVQAEKLWTLLRPGKPMPVVDFNEAWRYIALGSEHTWCAENPTEPYFQDAIWKVKQSYFREAADRTITLLDAALAPATDKSSGALGPQEGPSNGGIVVFNTNSWPHGGLVTLSQAESQKGDRVTDDQGNEVPAQRLSTGELAFLASDIPALGSRHYRVVPGVCQLKGDCKIINNVLENKYLRIEVDPVTGNISKMIELLTGRDFADRAVNGGLNAFRWMPGDSDNALPDSVIRMVTVEKGPLVVELRIDSKAPGCRSVSRSVRLASDLPWVELSNVVDKLPLVEKDGIHFGFGFNIPRPVTRVDIPWGVMRVEEDQWPVANRNYLAMQRWVDISNENEGITWCSLDAQLIEQGAMTANQTGTWAGERKPWLRKLEAGGTLYSWVMNNHWFTNFPLTQDGPVTFRYRILPHGPYNAVTANRFGLEQSQPLVALAADKNALDHSLVALDGAPEVAISVIKSSADGSSMLIRLRSVSDQPCSVSLRWPTTKPSRVNLCEREEIPGPEVKGEIPVPPYGLVTLKAIW